MKVELISYTQKPLETIEEAASTCYNSEPSPDGKIMMACYRSGHHSVLEHTSFSFKITGVSRSLLAQLTRHRVGDAFSVQSQRYCAEDGFGYVTPPSIQKNERAKMLYDQLMENISSVYTLLKSLEVPQEDSRFVLPNACETVITFTTNLRELIHICNERLCSRAQWEIRAMTQAMVNEVVKVFPECKEMLVPKCEKNKNYPYCPERQCCGRHKQLKEVYKNE
ncbi:MAG: FAD-dependent thymidylate synthase [Clostridia bacterium]|nr:FAD-dependent thymidylate synthase [Clostridia bacterium]